MINRRRFFSTLGTSAALAATPAFAIPPGPALPGSRRRIELNGKWEVHVDGALYDVTDVPSSRRPMGFYSLKRSFALPHLARAERAVIHFEAITYCARLNINGKQLGIMGPYVPYEFEFTTASGGGSYAVEVEMADLAPWPDGTGTDEIALGVNRGWEAYGGIIRDVWVEVRPSTYIENVRFAYRLSDGYGVADCRPRVIVSTTETGSALAEVILKRRDVEVARSSRTVQLKRGANEIELSFEAKGPALWSPEQPNLYELVASVKTGAAEDYWTCRTGFRDIVAQGRDFRLNGSRLVLNGVCRHDMWKEQGFTLLRQQQEQDMRMIKMLGCNFVRLVHYPHDRRITELADELGLLVSEEPGYWNMDFGTMPRSEIELGYRILEATIRRDWNSPSVMAWLLANECMLTTEFLKEGKERCNRLDPIGRLVSAANSTPAEKAKPMFVAAGMDFFDQHPYTYDLQQFNAEAELDGPGKPLTFTEWGGKAIGQTETVMSDSVNRLLDLIESGELAGHMFWSWQDLRQYTRIDGEMRDGILESGVVTEDRSPRKGVYVELARLFAGPRREGQMRREISSVSPPSRPAILPLRSIPFSRGSVFRIVDLQAIVDSPSGRQTWAGFETVLEKFWTTVPMGEDQWQRTGDRFLLWQEAKVEIGGAPFRSPVIDDHIRPLVLTAEAPEMTIPIDQSCTKLHILGQVTFPTGYPLEGRHGEEVAVYSLQYASGKIQDFPLRNGIEVAQSNRIHIATRIAPVATAAQPVLEFAKDVTRELYQVLLWSMPTDENNRIVALRCKLNKQQPALATFAITTERTSDGDKS